MPAGGYTSLERQHCGSTDSGMDQNDPSNREPEYRSQKNTQKGLPDVHQSASQSSENIPRNLEVIDPGVWTFRVCVIGLTFMWLTGIGVIAYGAVAQSILNSSADGYAPSYTLHKAVIPFVQLAVSFWVTILSDTAGLIHSTSLRWTLLASRKLTFNSNLRLFTSCSQSRVHWWPVNVVWAWSLVSSYACGAMLLVESVYNNSGQTYQLDMVSSYALIFLGLGLLGQASIATWALIVTDIPTWSTNPIQTAKVCQMQGWLAPLSRRTLLSVHDAQKFDEYDTPSLPKTRQGSLLKAHFRVRRALIFVWIVALLGFLWFAAISIAYQVGGGPSLGPSWGSFSRSYTSDWSLLPDWKMVTAYLGISTSLGQSFYTFGPWIVCKYILTCAILGSITINLHVVELLVQCSRDESLWRKAASSSGLGPRRYGAFTIAFLTWQTIALFVFKTIIHWIFSLAFGIYYEGIQLRIPQVCYTATTLFSLALLATFLALWQPKGPQPATFGHLPSLVDLIDVWPCRTVEEAEESQDPVKNSAGKHQETDTVTLYWGDKGEDQNGIRRAGTSFTPLEPIVMSALYL